MSKSRMLSALSAPQCRQTFIQCAGICSLAGSEFIMCVVQHEDRLASLDRREADLKAQQQSLNTNQQTFKDKEGVLPLSHF